MVSPKTNYTVHDPAYPAQNISQIRITRPVKPGRFEETHMTIPTWRAINEAQICSSWKTDSMKPTGHRCTSKPDDGARPTQPDLNTFVRTSRTTSLNLHYSFSKWLKGTGWPPYHQTSTHTYITSIMPLLPMKLSSFLQRQLLLGKISISSCWHNANNRHERANPRSKVVLRRHWCISPSRF